MTTPDLLNLSWKIQLALASGYVSYLLAYRGIRGGHQPVDITFITLVFGLGATAVLSVLPDMLPIFAGGIAFLSSCACALIWRLRFRGWLESFLRHIRVSYSNDDPSALATLANARRPITQVSVELDDGSELECRTASKFSDAPFGPVVIGPNGDIALYLTHEQRKGGAEIELMSVRNPDWGDRITYIPASRIRRIAIRYAANS